LTVQEEQDWVEPLGVDRLPEHIVGKRVTEVERMPKEVEQRRRSTSLAASGWVEPQSL
jgi:hypothetical protein